VDKVDIIETVIDRKHMKKVAKILTDFDPNIFM